MSTPPKERELFGTLLASTPPRSRSWKSLFLAIGLHVALLAIAVLTFKPFQRDPVEEEPLTISMIPVEEEDAVTQLPNPFVRSPVQPQVAAPAPRRAEDELVLPRGPLTPIIIESGPPTTTGVTEEPTGRVRAGSATLSDRLRPTYIDPRITTTTAFPPAEKTGAEAVRARIEDRLAAWNDSIAAEAEADRREDDWTIKGKDGTRWGVSSEGLHIGKITIPAKSIAFSPPPGRRDEIAARQRDFQEIEQQAYLEESRASFKERVKSIRERKDRERAEKKKAEVKPITDSR